MEVKEPVKTLYQDQSWEQKWRDRTASQRNSVAERVPALVDRVGVSKPDVLRGRLIVAALEKYGDRCGTGSWGTGIRRQWQAYAMALQGLDPDGWSATDFGCVSNDIEAVKQVSVAIGLLGYPVMTLRDLCEEALVLGIEEAI